MMKHFKKLTLVVVAAFTLLLTVAGGTISSLPLPSITVGQDKNVEPTPIPEINPLVDDDIDAGNNKTK